MKRKRTAALLLLLFLLAPLLFPQSAAAAESAGSDAEWDFSGGPDGVIGDFMAASGLNEENFAMGWYDTVSGEEWYYNPDAFFVAGSLYKLPLNMIYADRLADGEVTEKDYAGGWQIGTAMRASIVKSDNAAGEYYLPDAIGLLLSEGKTVGAFTAECSDAVLGANDPEQLEELNQIAKAKGYNC